MGTSLRGPTRASVFSDPNDRASQSDCSAATCDLSSPLAFSRTAACRAAISVPATPLTLCQPGKERIQLTCSLRSGLALLRLRAIAALCICHVRLAGFNVMHANLLVREEELNRSTSGCVACIVIVTPAASALCSAANSCEQSQSYASIHASPSSSAPQLHEY